MTQTFHLVYETILRSVEKYTKSCNQKSNAIITLNISIQYHSSDVSKFFAHGYSYS